MATDPIVPRLTDLLPDYLAYLTGKGHRPCGRQKYLDNLKLFNRWLGEEATTADLTEERITAYRDARAGQVRPGTVFNELVCVRSFCRWCVRRRLLTEDPTQHVDYPKVPKPHPRALKRTQLKLLFQIIDTEPATFQAAWRRNRIALLLLLYTGLRIREAAGLCWRDVDLDASNITVPPELAKNGRTRAIPIHPRLKDELRTLPRQEADRPIIGHTHTNADTPITPKSLGHVFERWLRKQGLGITAHQLRHTMATELLRAGASLPDIQAILGHEDLETTAIYLTVDAEHLRGAIGLLPAGW